MVTIGLMYMLILLYLGIYTVTHMLAMLYLGDYNCIMATSYSSTNRTYTIKVITACSRRAADYS